MGSHCICDMFCSPRTNISFLLDSGHVLWGLSAGKRTNMGWEGDSIRQVLPLKDTSLEALLLTEGGEVWLCDGENNFVQCPGLQDIKEIATNGVQHLALDDSGKVLSFKRNRFQCAPHRLETEPVSHIGSNNNRFVATTAKGIVYHISSDGAVTEEMTLEPGDYRAYGGWDHFVLLDQEGRVWTEGQNTYGQLGRTETLPSVYGLVEGLPYVQSVAVGGWHNFAVDCDSNVWVWGCNAQNRLGQEGRNITEPECSSVLKCRVMCAGRFHSFGVDISGAFLVFGNNSSGQLGFSSPEVVDHPMEVPDITVWSSSVPKKSARSVITM